MSTKSILMKDIEDAKLLRIFVAESDKVGHDRLYEKIVYEAKKHEMAGATVLQGIMSFGASSLIHFAKIVSISEDMPIIIEIVDRERRINDFLPVLESLLERATAGGGLITMEKVQIIHYEPAKKKS